MKKLPLFIIIFVLIISTANLLFAQDEEYTVLKTGTPPVIDGNLAEWADVPGVYLDEWEANGGSSRGPDDISLTLYMLWDEENFYFAAEVSDNEHLNDNVGDNIWDGDGIQLAIDPTGERNLAAFDGNTYEYNFGLGLNDDITISRLFGNPDSKGNEAELVIVRDDSNEKTYYELRIPAEDIAPANVEPNGQIGLGMICNDGDKDAPGQAGWVGWGAQSIVFGKDNTQMNLVIFSGEKLAVSSEGRFVSTWGLIRSR